jgi:hypothetical protein
LALLGVSPESNGVVANEGKLRLLNEDVPIEASNKNSVSIEPLKGAILHHSAHLT